MAAEQQGASDSGGTLYKVSVGDALRAAVSHHQAGRTELAERLYRDILAALPDHPDALQFLGVLLHGRGESREGAAMLRAASRLAPENASIWNNLGNALRALDETDAAIEAYGRAVALAPGDPAPRNNLGIVHRARNEPAEAEAAYRAAIACDASFADAWHNLAALMLAAERFREAVTCALRSLGVDPDAALTDKLDALFKAPRRQKAAAIFLASPAAGASGAADAHAPEDGRSEAAEASAWYDLALLMLAAEHYGQAATCNLFAASLDPAGSSPLELVGVGHALEGRTGKAAAVFRAWLEREPDNPLAQHYFAACGGSAAPARASDAYVERTFDDFAASFDKKLAILDYRAPGLVAAAVRATLGPDTRELSILDAGCGTGLSGREVRAIAGKLVGIDLSGAMLVRAGETGLYDALEKAELTQYLAARPGAFDVVLSADTLCYFGALEAFAAAAFAALAPGGILAFSAEAMSAGEAGDYSLQPNGRYRHSGAHIDRALAGAGFAVETRSAAILRTEGRQPVTGWIVTARRPPAA
jgi:predicted TPR repeat methyltransferase